MIWRSYFCVALSLGSCFLVGCGKDKQRGPVEGSGGSGAQVGTGGASGGSHEWTYGIPPLSTEGKHLVDPSGNVVILRGVATADVLDVDVARDGMTTRELIDLLSDESEGWFTRVVRLTVYPQIWLSDPETYFEEHLKPAVEHASQAGLYVIIDWHEIDDVEAVAERTGAFWEFMAPQFKDYTNVLYELFNEPVNSENPSWATWKSYAQPWVDAIRAVAPNNLILIGGPFWSQHIGEAATDPFVGSNLAYVSHVYSIVGAHHWSDFGPIAQVAAVHPVIITEWGFRDDGNFIWDGTIENFGQPLKTFIESHGLSWTAWCADSLWGPFMFDEDWQLLRGEGEMGGFVKDWLFERRNDDQPE